MARSTRNSLGFIAGIALIALVAISMDASATTTPPSPVGSTSNANASANSLSASHSAATAASGAVSGSVSGATVGNTTAAGGSAQATGGVSAATIGDVDVRGGDGGSASASNTGNSQAISVTHQATRNAPSVAQGSLMPSGCGVGANAGGSGVNGSGFLGIAFTSSECYAFALSQAFAAIGMPDTACDVLLTTKAAKRAFKDRALPNCTTAQNRDAAPAVVLIDNDPIAKDSPTKAEVNETVDRVLRKALEK